MMRPPVFVQIYALTDQSVRNIISFGPESSSTENYKPAVRERRITANRHH